MFGLGSFIIEGLSDGGQHALVGQFEAGVHCVLADDQAVLVGHYHSSEADVGLLALPDPVGVGVHVFLHQRVSFIQPQVHLPERSIDALSVDDLLELLLALRQQLRDQPFVPLQASWLDMSYRT